MRVRNMSIGIVAFALFAVSACSTSSSSQKSDETRTDKQAQTAEDEGETSQKEQAQEGSNESSEAAKSKKAAMCPMKVDGVETNVEKLDDAVAIDFTTGEGDVGALRKRVRKMADWHNNRGGMNKDQHGKKKGAKKGKKKGKMKKLLASSTADTEEIDGGIRMTVTPDNSDHLDKLHNHMSQHSEMMATGKGCPMKMMKGKQT